MTNKEKLEQLTDYIDKLRKLAENIYEREIYPVSFFSQAFDITNKIQDSLHQIEVAQIELFEKQMKEHQAQIRNIKRIEKKDETAQITSMVEEKRSKDSSLTENQQSVLSKTSPYIPEKETIIENKKAEAAYSSPLIEEQLPKTGSFADHPQIISSGTNQHIIKEGTEPAKKTEIQPAPLEEKLRATGNSPDNKSERKTLSDLKKAFTINDRFRFCRELFSSNENLMNQTFAELNNMESYNDSIAYIKEYFNWDWEEEITIEFISIIEKRFH